MKVSQNCFREAGVGGSNPLAPTNNSNDLPDGHGQCAEGERHLTATPVKRKYRRSKAPGRPNPPRESLEKLKAYAGRALKPHTHFFTVYFIREPTAGAIKIGIAFDPEVRLGTIQACHPFNLEMLGTCPGGLPLEKALHAEFAADRLLGEWFRPSERLTARIYELCKSRRAHRIRKAAGAA